MTSSIKSLQGAAQLLLDTVGGVTSIVERMHKTIADRANPLSGLMNFIDAEQGVTQGTTYRVIQAIKEKLQESVRFSAEELSVLEGLNNDAPLTTKLIAGLNGVCGDHLEATGNPLAIAMHFHTRQQYLELTPESIKAALPDASPDIVVMVHGLCLSHEYWHRHEAASIGEHLQQQNGATPLSLNYNTGRHISTNGRELDEQLAALIEAWPVKVQSLTLIGHSMGGLVIRSACHHAETRAASWLKPLKSAVYLGAPHHGSAVNKAAHLLTFAMIKTKYAEPLAFGQYVSAGIKDLRHGNLLDEDWAGVDQDDLGPDLRQPIPLTRHAEHYFLAAAVGENMTDLSTLMVGDLLVRLGSATGQHRDDLKRLHIKPDNCRIFHSMNHFDLLDDPAVQEQILTWLA